MPITNVNTVNVHQYCRTCFKERTHNIKDLLLGYNMNPLQVTLPKCECGSLEVIVCPFPNADHKNAPPIITLAYGLGRVLIGSSRIQPARDPNKPQHAHLTNGADNYDYASYVSEGFPDVGTPAFNECIAACTARFKRRRDRHRLQKEQETKS